jgi:hypothetical protein
MKITYIYLIELSADEVYIGKTVNPESRKYGHMSKYGYNIKYHVIDNISSTDSKDWKPLESYWIEQFKQWGFKIKNKNNGGGGPSYKSQESIQKVVNKLKKKIYQYDLDGNLIKIWDSIKEAKTLLGVDIDGCLKGKTKIAGNSIWKYTPTINFSPHLTSKKGNIVCQYSLDDKLIKIWRSANEAEKFLNNKIGDNIAACCRGKQKTAYGYLWNYKTN